MLAMSMNFLQVNYYQILFSRDPQPFKVYTIHSNKSCFHGQKTQRIQDYN